MSVSGRSPSALVCEWAPCSCRRTQWTATKGKKKSSWVRRKLVNEWLFLFVAKAMKEIIREMMSAHVQGHPSHSVSRRQRKQGSDWLLQDPSWWCHWTWRRAAERFELNVVHVFTLIRLLVQQSENQFSLHQEAVRWTSLPVISKQGNSRNNLGHLGLPHLCDLESAWFFQVKKCKIILNQHSR